MGDNNLIVELNEYDSIAELSDHFQSNFCFSLDRVGVSLFIQYSVGCLLSGLAEWESVRSDAVTVLVSALTTFSSKEDIQLVVLNALVHLVTMEEGSVYFPSKAR